MASVYINAIEKVLVSILKESNITVANINCFHAEIIDNPNLSKDAVLHMRSVIRDLEQVDHGLIRAFDLTVAQLVEAGGKYNPEEITVQASKEDANDPAD